MRTFSEKSLLALGEFYVYGLVDPRNGLLFYIGKGTGNRVFEHEQESLDSPDSEKLKLQTISEIHHSGLEVRKVILHSNMTENEAFAAEAALINAFNFLYPGQLTNIVAGHHSEEAMTVEEYEKIHGAEELNPKDIRHQILVIKINRLYHRNMDRMELYDSVRGVWRIAKERAEKIEYVFGVYHSLIVAVYKPTKWFVCKEATDKLPRQDVILTEKTENRLFFIDEDFENNKPMNADQERYLGKSIARLKVNQNAQNPITYLLPVL